MEMKKTNDGCKWHIWTTPTTLGNCLFENIFGIFSFCKLKTNIMTLKDVAL